MPKYAGVDTNHSAIKNTIKNLLTDRKTRENVARYKPELLVKDKEVQTIAGIVGMPVEVVERHRRELEKK